MSNFNARLSNIMVAMTEHDVNSSDGYINDRGETLLARLRGCYSGKKGGSHFLRTSLITDDNARCLNRSNDNANSAAELIIIDCDKRINSNGEILEGAPDPHKISKILRENNIAHVLYGSHSHYVGNKGNRFRIVLSTKTPYGKEQLETTLINVIALINSHLDGDLLANAKENGTWGQPWYFPRKPAGCTMDELYLEHLEGEAIDVIEPVEIPPTDHVNKEKYSPYANGQISPIDAFNQQNLTADLLPKYSYKRIFVKSEYEKWLSPNSTSGNAGITVKDNKFFSHHGSCSFNDGYWHDAFDLWKMEEGLTTDEAVKKAAQITRLPNGSTVHEYNEKLYRNGTGTENDKPKPLNDWPDPEPIKSELLPVEQLKKEFIPAPFRDFIVDISDRMQCPIDFIAIPLITITSIVIGAGCGIKPKQEDDWLVIPNLWGCTIGPPGIMKSPAMGESMQSLDKLQDESRLDYEIELKKYKAATKIYEARKKALEKEIDRSVEKDLGLSSYRPNASSKNPLSTTELEKLLTELEEPAKPIWKRFKTNDATIEKANALLAENPRGILVFRDELIGLLRSFDKIGHETDRQFYLESWTGTLPFTSDRVSRGTIDAKNLCISLLGTTQPDKLIKYLFAAINGDNDGLIQRFQLMVYPDDRCDWKLVDRKPNTEARAKVFSILKNLSKIDFVSQGATQNEGDRFPHFSFDKHAQVLYNEWITDLEANKLRNPDAHPLLIQHLSKFRSLMPSLALLFHLIEIAKGEECQKTLISEQNVVLAMAWCEYLESHANRVYDLVINAGSQAALVLADKIKRGKLKDGFTWRDFQRNEWGLLKNKDVVKEACEQLINKGWLEKYTTQKSKTAYRINPKLKKGDGSNG